MVIQNNCNETNRDINDIELNITTQTNELIYVCILLYIIIYTLYTNITLELQCMLIIVIIIVVYYVSIFILITNKLHLSRVGPARIHYTDSAEQADDCEREKHCCCAVVAHMPYTREMRERGCDCCD